MTSKIRLGPMRLILAIALLAPACVVDTVEDTADFVVDVATGDYEFHVECTYTITCYPRKYRKGEPEVVEQFANTSCRSDADAEQDYNDWAPSCFEQAHAINADDPTRCLSNTCLAHCRQVATLPCF